MRSFIIGFPIRERPSLKSTEGSNLRCKPFEWKRSPEEERGVIVGCDQHQEWLLPWWWERYSAENDFPVTFFDWGLTQEAKEWCRQRGQVVAVHFDFSWIGLQEEHFLQAVRNWEKVSSFLQETYDHALSLAQPFGFRKLFACLHTQYKRTVWIDLQCEILGNISPLFSQCTFEFPVAVAFDPKAASHDTAVIAYIHGSEIMRKWAEMAVLRSVFFWEENALLPLLDSSIVALSSVYNWKIQWGLNLNAVIYNWTDEWGKNYIKNYRGIKSALGNAK